LLNSISSCFAILDSKRIGSRLDLTGLCDVIGRSRDHSIPYRPTPIDGPLDNQAFISNGFRDIQWRIWRNGLRDV